MTSQAQTNQERALSILSLYNMRKAWIADLTRSQYAVRALDWFFAKPIFKTPDFVETSGIPKATANRIVREVKEAGILVEIRSGSGRRAAVLAFRELLNIAEGQEVFESHR